MKINDYTLTHDPEGVSEARLPLFTEMRVPFGDRIIFDENGVDTSYTFNLFLINEEIENITGMVEAYRLIYLEFDKFDGWFYVTKFDTEWVKMIAGNRMASISMEGYYNGENGYLKLGNFSSIQKTDFQTDEIEIVSLPDDYVTKESVVADYALYDGNISYYIDSISDVYFNADSSILKDGCIRVYNDGVRVYKDTKNKGEVTVNTNCHEYIFPNNNAVSMNIYDLNGNVITGISDALNYSLSTDKKINYNPFNTKIKNNHTLYEFMNNRPYFEIKKTPSIIAHASRNTILAIKPDVDPGTMELTTLDPSTLMVETRLAGGTVPTTIDYENSPGFIKHSRGLHNIATFTTEAATQPLTGFYADTERNFIGSFPHEPVIIPYAGFTLTNFTRYATGSSYYGMTNYNASATAGAYAEATINNKMKTGNLVDLNVATTCSALDATTGFTGYGSTLTSSTDWVYGTKSRSLKVDTNNSGASEGFYVIPRVSASVGKTYTAQYQFYGTSGRVMPMLIFRDSGGTMITVQDGTLTTLDGTGKTQTVTGTAPANTAYVDPVIRTTTKQDINYYVGEIILVEGTTIPTGTMEATTGAIMGDALEGHYDIYAMLSNYDTHPAGTWSFQINGSTVYDGSWTTGHTKAYNVYLGNYELTGSTSTLKFLLKTGKMAVYELILVPTNVNYGGAWEQVCSALLDTKEAYELY